MLNVQASKSLLWDVLANLQIQIKTIIILSMLSNSHDD